MLRQRLAKPKLTVLCFCLIAFGAASCAKNADAESQSAEDAVMQAQENLFELLLTKNASGLNKHYLPEVTRFHQEGELDVGWSEKRSEEFQSMFDNGLTLVLEDWRVVDLRVYGDTAITAGYANAGWQDSSGNSEVTPIRFTYVWVKTEDGWKEAHHHASDLKGELRF